MHPSNALAPVLALALVTSASGAQVLFGKKLLIRNPPSGAEANRVVHIAKDATVAVGASGSAGDPQCSGAGGGGGSLHITASGGAGDVTIPLPCAGWTTSASNKVYRYRDSSGATCQRVLVRAGSLVKAVCKGPQVAIDVGPDMAPVSVTTMLNTEEYVTEWAGDLVADGSNGVRFLAKNKPPPTTTSTTVVPTTTTSTLPCSCGVTDPTILTIATGAGVGACGSVTNADGTLFRQMSCGDLFAGGGLAPSYLPTAVPQPLSLVLGVETCSGGTLTLGPTTSAETGSNETCTSAGCRFFSGPLPLPYVTPADLSACLVPIVTGPASGTADCSTGTTTLNLPMELAFYFTQDAANPCARCVFGSCAGGDNNGAPCLSNFDCPQDSTRFVGNMPLPLALQTGAATWTATPATNDTGVEPDQARTFCGYCRDADGSGAFQSPSQACWRNGLSVGAACAQPFETCEQRSEGAFGPNGGSAQTISVTGMSPGNLTDHAAHAATLAGIYCMPFSTDPTTNAAFDLVSPGALTLTGTIRVE